MNSDNRQHKRSKLNTFATLALLIFLIAIALYFTVYRYKLIGEAISKGDMMTSTALALPEVARASMMML